MSDADRAKAVQELNAMVDSATIAASAVDPAIRCGDVGLAYRAARNAGYWVMAIEDKRDSILARWGSVDG